MKQFVLSYFLSFSISLTFVIASAIFRLVTTPLCAQNPQSASCSDPKTQIFYLSGPRYRLSPIERSIRIKNYSVRCRQVSVCPAFCLTDYKVQGKTLSKAILDLRNHSLSKGQDDHRKYCSAYAQVRRPCS
jgi:hypothetical protein